MPDTGGFEIVEAVRAPALGILTRTREAAPAFPAALFPPFWRTWIEGAAEGANAPADYVAGPLLAAAAALIGNARWVQAWPGWREPPVLWIASVGEPSSGKSPAAGTVMTGLLRDVGAHLGRDYPSDRAAWGELAAVSRAIEKAWEKEVAKVTAMARKVAAGEHDGPAPAMPPKPNEANCPPAPIRPRDSVADVTIEKLAELLASLPKGLLYRRDELAGWLGNMSRYSNGGTDRPFWLEAYVGGSHTVDRVKNPEPVYIPRLAVGVFGTIQPDRLAEVLTGADDGLLSRFLWTWPEARPFRRPPGFMDHAPAVAALIRLAELPMLANEAAEPSPSYVPLDAAAAATLADYGRDVQGREASAFGLHKGALGKARGQALRLALTLCYLAWAIDGGAEPVEIGVEFMQDAIGLVDGYFLPQAARVLADASVPPDEQAARELARWIAASRPDKVNVSDIRDNARLPGLRDTERVKSACRYLVEARWLFDAALTGAPGRPRGDYTVNPDVWPILPAGPEP